MADQTVEKFVKITNGMIKQKFSGDPLKLKSFLNDVDMVEGLATSNVSKAFCVKLIKSQLEGKAEECLTEDCDTVAKIKACLTEKIKPDSVKVIEGRMMALRLEGSKFDIFSEKAEKLAEDYRRGLVSEGVPLTLAEKMTIDRTIELCRKTARSDVVKSILESKQFATPKEVVSALVVQSNTVQKEYREKKNFKPQKFNKNDQKQRSFRSREFKNSNKNDNRFDSRNANQGQNREQNQSQSYGNRNQRGGGNSNRGGYRNNSNREHTIRVVTGPQPSTSNNQNNQNDQGDHFFRLT